MTETVSGLRALLLAVPMLALGTAMARAECYDILGCTNQNRFAAHADYLESRASGPTCAFLFTMRNLIYKEHGYCFHTDRARAELGNDGCFMVDAGALSLNPTERANVATIARAEAVKGCPRS